MTPSLPNNATVASLAAAIGLSPDNQTLRLFAQELGVFSAHAALQPRQAARVRGWLRLLAAGTPREYILGHQDFAGVRLRVSPSVLIPRSDSEIMVQQALLWLRALAGQPRVLLADIGTGSGALLAATLHAHGPLPAGWQAHAVDASKRALAVAQKNFTALGLKPVLHHGDLLAPLSAELASAPVVVLLVNLPYITEQEYAALDASVREHEPAMALRAGADGLLLYRRMLAQLAAALPAGGVAIFEASPSTVLALVALVHAALPAAATRVYADAGTTRQRGVCLAWGTCHHLLEKVPYYDIIA